MLPLCLADKADYRKVIRSCDFENHQVIGAEKSKIKKIHTTMLEYPGIHAYYVGDTKGDMIEGKNAGTITIGVTWGWHTTQKLKEGSPDYLVNTPKELADFLVQVS